MKLTCDEATTICDKTQYGEAGLWERVKLGLHFLMCRTCGLYSKQNQVMTKCYHIHKETSKYNKSCLCDEDKKEIEQNLKSKM
ncbi:hypothetical protein [Lutibacter sp.]